MTETRAGGPGADAPRPPRGADRRASGGGPFARLMVFLRQVVAELKKVVRPTRNELLTYTAAVLVFVAAVMVYVSGLDVVFGRLVFWAFGDGA